MKEIGNTTNSDTAAISDSSKRQFEFSSKHLIIVLSVLGVLIVGFVVGIILVNINMSSSQNDAAEDGNEENSLYWDGMSDEEYQEAKFLEDWYDIEDRVNALLNEDPIDVDTINSLYSTAISKEIANNRTDHVYSYIIKWEEKLTSKGLDREALDVLQQIDYSIFHEPDRYRLYKNIVELAEKTGDDEVRQKYLELMETVEDAYNEDVEITENALTTRPTPEEVMSNNIELEEP